MDTAFDILLIEDNPCDAELAIRALQQCGLAQHLAHVADGQEALDFLFGASPCAACDVQAPPKVVLLDLKLPKIDGIEVLRRIRADERTRLVPVVVLTSSREERDVAETYHSGANSYIVKPVDFETFLEVIGNTGLYWLKKNVTPSY